MPIRIAELSAHDAQIWLPEALNVYVTAMNYPPGTEVQRAPLWHDHIRRPGWKAVAAIDSPGPAGREALVGIAYGYSGAHDQWWNQQVRSGLVRAGCSRERVSALTEISMFTEGEDIALAEVFTNIWNYTGGQKAVSHKESPEKIKEEFAKVLPTYDRDRVHVSDMKKCFAWYNTLVEAGFTEFKLPEEQSEESAE